MWDLIVSVPDHCLSFYFSYSSFHLFNLLFYIIVHKFPTVLSNVMPL